MANILKFRGLVFIISLMIALQSFVLANSFSDLENHDWAKEYIEDFSKKGIISGYDDGTFKPDKFVTREEFAKIIVEAFELKVDDKDFGFNDVNKDAWYAKYVNTLANMGLVKGINEGEFGVGQSITREDLCTILNRVLEKLENTLDMDDSKEFTFEDVDKISNYAKDAISKLYKADIINGVSKAEVKPKDSTTRAQMVKMVYLLKAKSKSKEQISEKETSGEKTTEETKKVKKERVRTVTINGKEYELDPNEPYPHGTKDKLVTFVQGKKGIKIKGIYTADELLQDSEKITNMDESLIKVKSGDTERVIDLDILKKDFKGEVVVLKIGKNKSDENIVESVKQLGSINEMKLAKGNKILIWPSKDVEFDEIEKLFILK